ncbi:exosome complex exonuclease RRP44-like isoform X1 [Amphibalanus amphitrite]|uniref:exosome complex exonuclease RRP44-like isoform X1 n=1 Tax=Amphibalanus amphitrite TaxID=1232801 RepID=UPI001C8FC46F|nr:exosome complex exonuclease RRP44-like isoform X1 [Amphibalanus amphitrite]XP_043218244.1 exosome complex exonuclease RRP44-like isoform X1 [Amphibalanus amphitrite]XP_043218245.1 exosome complex exonuclease RRP44-like isoform X2 [Amphibalanus amphitrite]XP_043218246.1 exosome complex exonuclease RRP44-like isoform X1 [Amphibalanus amphitrite]XP_043218247.1 exosome complex exonuclease RRP44-like isoform X1 [Amphibalanus amphitrite]XP_043218248.1 exosome complex exonuclease RRP44-like isofor
MLKQKVFLKKNRRGNVLKIVREHYLRDDLWCGVDGCSKCELQTSGQTPLSRSLESPSTAVPEPHVLIPDTNVILHQLEILSSDAIKNVVLLKTVLDEARKRSPPLFKKLTDLMSATDKRCYVFINEHHKDTFVERVAGETSNDYSDRLIRRAAHWYSEHLEGSGLRALLLTDDRDNLRRAKKEGVPCMRVSAYVWSLSAHPELVDQLAALDCAGAGDHAVTYPEHLSLAALQSGVRTGRLRQGKFFARDDNYLEATVMVEGLDQPVLLQGRYDLNRAVQDDIVAVELYPKDRWSVPSNMALLDTGFENDYSCERDFPPASCLGQPGAQPTGRVVGIIKRKWRQYCGMVELNPIAEEMSHQFVPANDRIPRVVIQTARGRQLAGQRVVVSIDSWPRNSRYPQGHFCRDLGKIGTKSAENEVLLLEHDVPHSHFSEPVLACLPQLPWVITPQDEANRVDLRHVDVCSVDPPGCTDIDDALHCIPLKNGNYEVGVHIADVSHFIRPGTAIDKEAANRGTTVYLIDKRIDMVPDLLSSNLCSLRGGETRFAFSCIWEITPKAEIVNTKFHKSIIRSRAALTYAEAQLKIDDVTQQDAVSISLRGLNMLAKQLKQRRLDDGALLLASPEIRFHIDSETHDPIDVQSKQLLETNSMVEEFMLLANVSVAEQILHEFPECALLRRHPEPPPSNFLPLIKAARLQGFELDVSSNKRLQESLNSAVKPATPYFNTMLRIMATRCMMQAVYFCTGTVSRELYQHYGLAAPIYTHFTSPIRRYADIIVHRLLAVVTGQDSTYKELLDKRRTQNTCNHINYRHRMAQYSQRASVGLHTHLFFRERVREEEGYVLQVKQNAVSVLVPKYGLESTILLPGSERQNATVQFVYDEQVPCQSAAGVTLRTFDKVIVQLSVESRNIQQQKLVMKLVKPEIPGFTVEPLEPPPEPLPEPAAAPEPTKPSSKASKRQRADAARPTKKKTK